MPELGTRTDWVRTGRATMERCSFKRSWEDKFHNKPGRKLKKKLKMGQILYINIKKCVCARLDVAEHQLKTDQ